MNDEPYRDALRELVEAFDAPPAPTPDDPGCRGNLQRLRDALAAARVMLAKDQSDPSKCASGTRVADETVSVKAGSTPAGSAPYPLHEEFPLSDSQLTKEKP